MFVFLKSQIRHSGSKQTYHVERLPRASYSDTSRNQKHHNIVRKKDNQNEIVFEKYINLQVTLDMCNTQSF